MTTTKKKTTTKIRTLRAGAAELRSAAERASGATSTKAALPILSSLLIEKGSVTGTDLDKTIRAACPMRGQEFGVAVPARLFSRCLAHLSGEVTMEYDGGAKLTMADGRMSYVLKVWPGSDFPTSQAGEIALTQTVSAADWAWIWRRVRTSYTRDDTRPVLEGVHLEFKPRVGLTAAATDSYRLVVAQRKISSHKTQCAILAGTGLSLISKLAAVADAESFEVGFSADHVVFRIGGDTLTLRVVFGEYPKYEQLFPDEVPATATLDRVQLIEAVRGVAVMAEKNAPVRLGFNDGSLTLRTQAVDVGEAIRTLTCAGAVDMEFGIHQKFLIDCLGTMDSPEVDIGLSSPLRPMVISEPGCRYAIMPILLSDSAS